MTTTTHTSPDLRAPRSVVLTCLAMGGLMLTFGLWAFVAPASFFAVIATFEPYNRHLIHDMGALQVGLGVALVLAAARSRAGVVALGGFVAFEGLHVVSHVLDRDLGGRPGRDLAFLALVTLIGAAALLVLLRAERAGRRTGSDAVEEPSP